MKKLLTLSVLAFSGFSMAQAPDFEDLVILYADQKYDKCIAKCEKYKNKDATRKEPLPYLYWSMSLFEISQDQSWMQKDPIYKKAFDMSIRQAATFTKKDRDKTYQQETEVIDYFERLKGAILEDIDSYMHGEKKKYSKCVSELKRLTTFAPDDAGAWILKGVCEYYNKNRTGSREDFKTGRALLENLNFKEDVMHMSDGEELSDIEDWEKELENNHTARLLMNALIEAAKMNEANRQHDIAVDYINMGKQWFEDVKAYMEVYNEIVN